MNEDGQWKEHGRGYAKILYAVGTGRCRLVMRKDRTNIILLNQLVQPEAVLVPAESEGNESGPGRAFVFEAEDFATGPLHCRVINSISYAYFFAYPIAGKIRRNTFALRFKDSEIASDFADRYAAAQERNRVAFAAAMGQEVVPLDTSIDETMSIYSNVDKALSPVKEAPEEEAEEAQATPAVEKKAVATVSAAPTLPPSAVKAQSTEIKPTSPQAASTHAAKAAEAFADIPAKESFAGEVHKTLDTSESNVLITKPSFQRSDISSTSQPTSDSTSASSVSTYVVGGLVLAAVGAAVYFRMKPDALKSLKNSGKNVVGQISKLVSP